MKMIVSENADKLGEKAAKCASKALCKAIEKQGYARLLVSTGASQFETLKSLADSTEIDWSKVEMFHLDEYVKLSESHPASFRKYLKERFTSRINLKAAYFVDGEGDVDEMIKNLTEEIRKAPIDVALIGIGVNAHIAFNDPPADFETKEAYIKVNLDDECKMQQVGEGWFAGINDVPCEAISMTVYQIMQSKKIISSVPHKVKANAIAETFRNKVTNKVPSTMLKTHSDWNLYIDKESASDLLS
jgi:glucosamine-6-phosphate deaminase